MDAGESSRCQALINSRWYMLWSSAAGCSLRLLTCHSWSNTQNIKMLSECFIRPLNHAVRPLVTRRRPVYLNLELFQETPYQKIVALSSPVQHRGHWCTYRGKKLFSYDGTRHLSWVCQRRKPWPGLTLKWKSTSPWRPTTGRGLAKLLRVEHVGVGGDPDARPEADGVHGCSLKRGTPAKKHPATAGPDGVAFINGIGRGA
ncbi:hypothetical protein AAG570_008426 [Ranatra chinensis]|uniref:Uncharacterized protein n=1 Tax=Ranatra chinensis TaxID=642074 RepID=A0ABD0YQZ0_9HEMI